VQRLALLAFVLAIGAGCARDRTRTVIAPEPPPQKTVADRLAEYGDAARARLVPHFTAAGVAYPPTRVVLVGLKRERQLLVYAASADASPRYVRTYPVLGASGQLGPKLREGDRQVPEGLYRIEYLNPNSRYHLSLRIDYPNPYDLMHAAEDGRSDPGGDIMIHGGSGSTGCLAMGDEAAEELFVLAADVSYENVEVILSPLDFRVARLSRPFGAQPAWIAELYADIGYALAQLPPLPTERAAPAINARRDPVGSDRTSRPASDAPK
jgi:murein L,D-transpeptidase YafK